jgi:hypothetical protein
MIFIKMGLNWFEPNNFGQVSTGTEICIDWTFFLDGNKVALVSISCTTTDPAGHRCKLMRTSYDQRVGVHGTSTGKSGAIWCKFLKFLA